ncbi:MAG: MBL fold metallo-hydrolase [Rhodospirillaceae bacterium]|nr:MBL fold metallo-hydrolase [Rhodospirillaceae bacterium]
MAISIPYRRDIAFEYATAERVSPLIRRVVARNPSAFTFHGTGTYIVGNGTVAIIDPGPHMPEHIDALLGAVAGETVTHLVVTHTHRDHSPAARALKQALDAPIYGCGPHGTLASGAGVEEGADSEHRPDVEMRDGDAIRGQGWTLEAVATPGHTSNHLCFALPEEKALFSGDHVMGWSTTVVSPPDGDMHAYMTSLKKLLDREDAIYWPTHGPSIDDPKALVCAYIAHREERERQILACLADGPATIPEMVARMYADVDPRLHRAAGRSVLAHLEHMIATGRVVRLDPAVDASEPTYGRASGS